LGLRARRVAGLDPSCIQIATDEDSGDESDKDSVGDGDGGGQGREDTEGDDTAEGQGSEDNKGDDAAEGQGREDNKGDDAAEGQGREDNKGDDADGHGRDRNNEGDGADGPQAPDSGRARTADDDPDFGGADEEGVAADEVSGCDTAYKRYTFVFDSLTVTAMTTRQLMKQFYEEFLVLGCPDFKCSTVEFFGSTVYCPLPDSDIDLCATLQLESDPGVDTYLKKLATAVSIFNRSLQVGRVRMVLVHSTGTMYLYHGRFKVDLTYQIAGAAKISAISTTRLIQAALDSLSPCCKIACRVIVDWLKHVKELVYVDYRDKSKGPRPKGCHMYMVLVGLLWGGHVIPPASESVLAWLPNLLRAVAAHNFAKKAVCMDKTDPVRERHDSGAKAMVVKCPTRKRINLTDHVSSRVLSSLQSFAAESAADCEPLLWALADFWASHGGLTVPRFVNPVDVRRAFNRPLAPRRIQRVPEPPTPPDRVNLKPGRHSFSDGAYTVMEGIAFGSMVAPVLVLFQNLAADSNGDGFRMNDWFRKSFSCVILADLPERLEDGGANWLLTFVPLLKELLPQTPLNLLGVGYGAYAGSAAFGAN